jgi:autotransporter-associated beta strand protein
MNQNSRLAQGTHAWRALPAVLAAGLCLSAATVAQAQTPITWTGASNASWGTGSNWSGAAVPGTSSDATFNGNGINTFLNVSGTVNKLIFGGTASIAGSAAANNATATLQINNGLTHTANNSGSSFMRIQTLVLGGNQTWDLNGTSGTNSTSASGFTLTTQNSGAAAMNTFNLGGNTWTKAGSGQVSFGNTTIGNGNIVIDNGSIRFGTGSLASAGISMQVNGSGTMTVKAGAALILNNGASTGSFDITKAIRMEGTSGTPSILQYAGGSDNLVGAIASPIEWAGVTNLTNFWTGNSATLNSQSWTFSGSWTGSGTVNLVTSSTSTPSSSVIRKTTLSGSNAGFTGVVNNQQSAAADVRFASSNAGSANAEWQLNDANATYKLAGLNIAFGALSGTAGSLGNYGVTTTSTATIGGKGIDSTFSGLIIDGSTAPLAVVKAGAGTLTLNGTSSYTGGTTVSAGRLRGTTSGVQGAITNNAAVEFSQATTGTYAGIMGGSGSFTKSGAGSVTLSGSNIFSGLTDVQEGTLAYGVANALGSGNVQVSGGTLNIATFNDSVGTVTLASGSIAGTTGVLSGTAYEVRGGAISAILGGNAVALTKSTSGTVTLSGVSTYSGQTRVSAGVLALGVSGAISNQSNLLVDGGGFNLAGFNDTVGTVTITSGSIFGSGTLTGSSYDIQGGAVTAILGGSGGLTKSTSGTTVLSGINAYTGVTAVNAGTLAVNGSIAASSGVGVSSGATLGGSGAVSIISGEGLVSPGNSPGILTATSIDPSTGMDFAFELTGTGSPTYGNASNSVNDVLRLTAATPALSPLNTNNVVSIYFGGSIAEGDTFRGGTYVDSATTLEARDAFATAISGANWQYYVYGNGGGTHAFNGTSYYTLGEYNSSLTITRTVVADSANFSGGTVNGAVTQFVVVPEPGALAFVLTGIGGFMAWAVRQRSRRAA